MKTNHISRCLFPVLIVLGILLSKSQVIAQQTTAFTYQGQLRDGGTNANGAYTMNFKLYDAVSGGGQIGSTVTVSPTLANGLFSVNLDFGTGAFNGNSRWLDITAQSGTSPAETLSPRVQVLPAPYAQFAAFAATVTNGAIMNAQLAGNAVNTTNVQNGAITTAQLAAGSVTNATLTANAVATANIQNSSVTDAKIVSVSGSKVSGAVASAIFASSATTAGTATLANSVAAGSITTASLQGGAVTAAKIASGQVVTSLNGLMDAVTLSAGTNVTVTTNGNSLQISANGLQLDPPWTTSVGSYDGIADSLMFSANGVTVMGISPAGRLNVQGKITAQDTLQANGGLSLNNMSAKGVNGSISITAANFSIDGTGNASFSGNVTALSFTPSSDRNIKQDFAVVNPREVLARVTELPIQTWTFKQDTGTRHIGPMAQDFYASFGVGLDDKHIATVDADGVALAAIQGLHSLVKDKDAEIADLKKRLETLEKIVLKQNGGDQ